MHKGYLTIAALLGGLSVILGAFGAHALKGMVSEQILNAYETGVRYQFYHVFALIATAMLLKYYPGKYLLLAGRLFVTGIFLFSGSLYLITLFNAANITGLAWVGAITPLGGIVFIAAWCCLAIGIRKSR